jgi:hypothetical protein
MGIPNIGPKGIRRRRTFGLVTALLGVALLALLSAWGASRPWRLAVFPFFWMGALGWLQAREKT